MAPETQTNPNLDDIKYYQYGGLAEKVMENHPELVGGSLEMLADDLDAIGADKGRRELFKKYGSDPNVAGPIIESYAKPYKDALGNLTFGELFEYYKSNFLGEYVGDELITKYEAKFKEYEDTKVSSILDAFGKARYALDAEKYGVKISDEDKKKAKETIDKYKKILGVFNLVENAKINKLTAGVYKKTLKNTAKEL